jgi:hypothetical protein
MSCISFADLLSGLYAGKLEGHALKELKNYASKFMGAEYTADRVDVLYECFRHKVAHLAQPYAVFDTQSKPNTFGGQGRRLITWTVRASGAYSNSGPKCPEADTRGRYPMACAV